jgi:hypothetical protein
LEGEKNRIVHFLIIKTSKMKKHDYKQITGVPAAFEAEGVDLNSVDEMFANVPEKFRESMKRNFKREVSMAALNGPHVPNWADTNEEKWFPWWAVLGKKDGSPAVGLRLYDCGCVRAAADVGPRQVLKDEPMAQHYAEHFQELDEEFYSPTK